MSVTQRNKKPSFKSAYHAVKKLIKGGIRGIAANLKGQFIEVREGREQFSLLLRAKRRANFIAKVTAYEAKFGGVSIGDSSAEFGNVYSLRGDRFAHGVIRGKSASVSGGAA